MKCYDPSREEMEQLSMQDLEATFREAEMAAFARRRSSRSRAKASTKFCDPQLVADRALVVMHQRLLKYGVPVDTGMTRSELFSAWRRYTEGR